MKSIIGLVRPEQGEILYDGRNLLDMGEKQVKELRKEIGMLFQGSALFDSETVLGNVMFPLMMFTGMSRGEQLDRARFCLERVNLQGAEKKYPSEISGGMQKRVAIARAIALNPRYLSATNPTPDSIRRPPFSLTNFSTTSPTNTTSPPSSTPTT